MTDDERRFDHESYGMIGVSRISGSGSLPMFGSGLDHNPSLISITIRRGYRVHSLGHDQYVGNNELIRVWLTPAQYAEMISNPNVGYGVPCTIRHVGGRSCEDPPKVETEAASVRERFELESKELVQKAREGADKVRAVLETSKLSQKAKAEIQKTFYDATRFLHDAGPFLVESFQEAIQKTVTEAKLEIDAFMVHAAHAVGVQALSERASPEDKAALLARMNRKFPDDVDPGID